MLSIPRRSYTNGFLRLNRKNDSIKSIIPPSVFYPQHQVRAIIFDLAGTVVDPGCQAPVKTIQQASSRFGIEITEEEARKDMGNAKRKHLELLFQNPRIRQEWFEKNGKDITKEDIDAFYTEFVSIQETIIKDYAGMVPGSKETLSFLKEAFNVQLGSTTGYTRSMVTKMMESWETNPFDFTIASDEVRKPRPFPNGCLFNLNLMKVTNPFEGVKVGDTPIDIEEGKNAGMWAVGVIKWSNFVGLDVNDTRRMMRYNLSELNKKYEDCANLLYNAKPHYLAMDIMALPLIVNDINQRLQKGEIL